MNPFKWFARWILAEELSDFARRIDVQEGEISRLMEIVRKDGSQAAERIGSLHIANRSLNEGIAALEARISAALEVHDKAKAPNSTVKRMARLLRQR